MAQFDGADATLRLVNFTFILAAVIVAAVSHGNDAALQAFTFTSTLNSDATQTDFVTFDRTWGGFTVTDVAAGGAFAASGFKKDKDYDDECDLAQTATGQYSLELAGDCPASILGDDTSAFTCDRVPGCRHDGGTCGAQSGCAALTPTPVTAQTCMHASEISRPAGLPCKAGTDACADYDVAADSLQHLWPRVEGNSWEDNCNNKKDWSVALLVFFIAWCVAALGSVITSIYINRHGADSMAELGRGMQFLVVMFGLVGLTCHIGVAFTLGVRATQAATYDVEQTFLWKFASHIGRGGDSRLTIEEEHADGMHYMLSAFSCVMISTGIVVSRLLLVFIYPMFTKDKISSTTNLYARMSLL